MAIVEFTRDCTPYCKGDRLQMDEEEMKDVDELAEKRGISKPYKVVEDVKPEEPTETVEAVDEPAGDRVKPVLSQDAVDANLSAPGVEAVAAAEDQREAKAAAKKTK